MHPRNRVLFLEPQPPERLDNMARLGGKDALNPGDLADQQPSGESAGKAQVERLQRHTAPEHLCKPLALHAPPDTTTADQRQPDLKEAALPPANDAEFIMPVSADAAAMQFVVEAMRQQTDVLKSLRSEMKDKHEILQDVRDRVMRIEATVTEARIERLEADMEALKSDKDRRDGATTALGTLWRNLPSIAAFVVGIAVIAFLFAKATGRVQ